VAESFCLPVGAAVGRDLDTDGFDILTGN
jgi:hypothetical protein